MCGEYVVVSARPPGGVGSSPRVWGILAGDPPKIDSIRFIPTCVGNTRYPWQSAPLPTVHPHVCGEYSRWRYPETSPCGSSPRVWGIRRMRFAISGNGRFIPTCVGNTERDNGAYTGHTVHPHVCGEYYFSKSFFVRMNGSSPRVWGILGQKVFSKRVERFIPTCVGNTYCISKSILRCSVHPHVCGEYRKRRAITMGVSGSSPRVWGILVPINYGERTMRFIPTCVGNTFSPRPGHPGRPVHPHVCGEYPGQHRPAAGAAGSSPRVWGIRLTREKEHSVIRFIPTCVGNTI